jgi:hypothetical protein
VFLHDLLQSGGPKLEPARSVELCEALAERGVRAGRTLIELPLLVSTWVGAHPSVSIALMVHPPTHLLCTFASRRLEVRPWNARRNPPGRPKGACRSTKAGSTG